MERLGANALIWQARNAVSENGRSFMADDAGYFTGRCEMRRSPGSFTELRWRAMSESEMNVDERVANITHQRINSNRLSDLLKQLWEQHRENKQKYCFENR
jgi:hypothetical protein